MFMIKLYIDTNHEAWYQFKMPLLMISSVSSTFSDQDNSGVVSGRCRRVLSCGPNIHTLRRPEVKQKLLISFYLFMVMNLLHQQILHLYLHTDLSGFMIYNLHTLHFKYE